MSFLSQPFLNLFKKKSKQKVLKRTSFKKKKSIKIGYVNQVIMTMTIKSVSA